MHTTTNVLFLSEFPRRFDKLFRSNKGRSGWKVLGMLLAWPMEICQCPGGWGAWGDGKHVPQLPRAWVFLSPALFRESSERRHEQHRDQSTSTRAKDSRYIFLYMCVFVCFSLISSTHGTGQSFSFFFHFVKLLVSPLSYSEKTDHTIAKRLRPK